MNKNNGKYRRYFERLAIPPKKINQMYLNCLALSIIYFFLDLKLAIYFHENGFLFFWAEKITKLGHGLFILTTLALFFVYAKTQNDQKRLELIVKITITFLLVAVITHLLKISFTRARPIMYFKEGLYGFYFFHLSHDYSSFPSGHTMAITSLLYSMSKIWPRLLVFFMTLAFLIGFSRVIVGAHYLSDVVMGFALSIYLVDLIGLFNKPNNNIMLVLFIYFPSCFMSRHIKDGRDIKVK
ncbi:MAG: phosphatase PAP2 family protein [Legionella sp.]|nr:phosphatase PAP2 family protein [Legionella sp.]